MSDPCQDAKDLETAASETVSDALDLLKAASRTVGALCDCPSPTGPALQPITDAVSVVRTRLDEVDALIAGFGQSSA